jgi:hypothetical protein
MEGLFPLSRMVAGGGVFGEEGNVLPSTSSMITRMEMLPNPSAPVLLRLMCSVRPSLAEWKSAVISRQRNVTGTSSLKEKKDNCSNY